MERIKDMATLPTLSIDQMLSELGPSDLILVFKAKLPIDKAVLVKESVKGAEDFCSKFVYCRVTRKHVRFYQKQKNNTILEKTYDIGAEGGTSVFRSAIAELWDLKSEQED